MGKINLQNFNPKDLETFCQLDDTDVWQSLKMWQNHPDATLSYLARSIVSRKLPKAEIRQYPILDEEILAKKALIQEFIPSAKEEAFVHATQLEIVPYEGGENSIQILFKDGTTAAVEDAPQQILTQSLEKITQKFHFCYLNSHKFERLR